jgi:hypothetical protein
LGGKPLQGARENRRGLRVDAVAGVGQHDEGPLLGAEPVGRRSGRTDAVRDDVERLDGGGLLGGVKQTGIDLLAMVGKLRPSTAAV